MISIDAPSGRRGMSGQRKKKKRVGRPVAVICYICGRQYGRSSLGIHLRQCKKLWNQREALKPEYERKPLPTAPENMERAVANGDIQYMDERAINNQNKAASNAYNNEALDACPHCNRSFLEGPLKIHMRSCRPGRLIGERLMKNSGKAGGNLGLKADPRNSKHRPGTAPQGRNRNSSERRNKRADRIPIRERMAAMQRRGGGNIAQENTYQVMEPPRSAPHSAPHSGSSTNARSALSHSGRMQMQTSPSSVVDEEEDELELDHVDHVNEKEVIDGWDQEADEQDTNHNNRNEYEKGNSEDVNGSEQWHEAWDPKSGRDFYYNNKGETRWTLPKKASETSVPISSNKKRNGRAGNGSASIEHKLENASSATIERVSARRVESNRRTHDQEGHVNGRGREKDNSRIEVLENKVASLEDKLDWALGEIDKLSSKLGKLYKAFAED